MCRYLSGKCSKIWLLDVSNEFWPGSNQKQFHRFENVSENALLVAADHHKLYAKRVSAWFEEDDLTAVLSTTERVDWAPIIQTHNINHIITTGGIAITESMEKTIGRHADKLRRVRAQHSPPLSLPTTRALLSELMLGDYLIENFEIINQTNTMVHRYDVSREWRELGLWWMGKGRREFEESQVPQFVYWRRRGL